MSRKCCTNCLRPLKTCICNLVQRINNDVQLIILQHPLEINEAKNSGRLLHLCLKNSQLFTGETFDQSLFTQDEDYSNLLLYPETAEINSLGLASPRASHQGLIADNLLDIKPLRLWVLDATWRKSRKMLYLNSGLQTMPRLSLQNCPPTLYTVRKAHSKNQLSTLEASCYALQQLEHHKVDYAPVLNAFMALNKQLQFFLPRTL